MKRSNKLTKYQWIKIILFMAFLLIFFFIPAFDYISRYAIDAEFVKFIIPISLAMAGFSIISFQEIKSKNSDIKSEFQNAAIIMLFSGLSGVIYLLPSNSEMFGKLSGLLFIGGIISFLAIFIEERFIR